MRFRALDGCRGFAALMVALQRLQADGFHADWRIVQHSFLFVDFFFVLSGFVIAHGWADRLAGEKAVAPFVIRRFGRVWPLHAFLLLVFIGIEAMKLWAERRGAVLTIPAFTGTQAPSTIVPNLLLVHALGFYDYLSWNVPSWSISTEFWTYVLFALVWVAGGDRRHLISAVLIAVSMAIVMRFSSKGIDVTQDFGIWRCIAGFLTGVLVQALWRATQLELRGRGLAAMEVAGVALAVAFVWAAGTGPLSFAAPLVFGVLVYVLAFEEGRVSQLLVTRPFQALGAWSYAIYMVNALIVLMIVRLANSAERMLGRDVWVVKTFPGLPEQKFLTLGPKIAMDGLAIVYLAVVIFASAILFRLIETPGRRIANRLADRVATGGRVKPMAAGSEPPV